MWARFRSNPLQALALCIVFGLHLFFIAIMLISPSFVFKKKIHKPLIVKTIVPKQASPVKAATIVASPAPVKRTATPPPPSPPPKPQVTKPKPAPSPVKKEPAIADKTISKTKQPVKKNTPAPPKQQQRARISDDLMRELEQSIAKIDQKPVKTKSTNFSPSAPLRLQIDLPSEDMASIDYGYTDRLVDLMHQTLSLPEFGEVKIQLSLRQDGTVVKLIVLRTQNEKNKQYLERELPKLKFPRFDGAYENKKEYTFILTFCNE